MQTQLTTGVESLRARGPLGVARLVGFALSLVVFVLFWALAFGFGLGAVFRVWFDPGLAATSHLVHDVALHTWVWVWGVGMLAQFYRPSRRVTAMQVALLLTLVDAGVSLATGVFDPSALLFFGPVVVAAALHPARREVFGLDGVSGGDFDPVLFALAGLAVVPVGLYVLGQASLQSVLADEHAALGHYATMAYYGLSLLGVGLLAAVRSGGRRVAAYGAALLAVMLGVASLFRPTASGLDPTWAALGVLWGLAFVTAYEVGTRRAATDVASAPDPSEVTP
jgi:hypothetical protein